MENLAPIVLFTYNRPDHTRQTVEALQRNVYAKESVLYICSDAPKTETAAEAVQAVRDYLHTIDGFREVHIILREQNRGLAENIIDGVTQIVSQYGKIIVLEDDIVTGKYFLKYMNDALECYKDEDRVMMVHGHNVYIAQDERLDETFFIESGGCWGWATWVNAWKRFDRNPEELLKKVTKEQKYRINFDDVMPNQWEQVEQNADGRLYTWGVFWHACIVLQRGLGLFPKRNLAYNIGFDGSGEHDHIFGSQIIEERQDEEIQYFPDKIEENALAREKVKESFLKKKPSQIRRILHKIYAALKRCR
ncbi:glycosyltransferase [Selenomonas sp. TAMA-11512]|uniref:glycosyltransferase family 2 protein n=1 Tax=Selenomonas sp. TAMA-11512 TaxID=3095337 RepID=UPI0030D529F9